MCSSSLVDVSIVSLIAPALVRHALSSDFFPPVEHSLTDRKKKRKKERNQLRGKITTKPRKRGEGGKLSGVNRKRAGTGYACQLEGIQLSIA